MERRRVDGLDYLRGILACAVMIYHYQAWLQLNVSTQSKAILSQIGLYAVSTFYVLSGMALYIVYKNRDVNRDFLVEFSIKRAARILPLFWIVTTIALYKLYSAGVAPTKQDIFLCYSMLFSWVKPTAYFSIGTWSIGNEWAYYTLFPLLLLAWRTNWRTAILFVTGTIALGVYFAFVRLGNWDEVPSWPLYIHPLNQFFLFTCGFALTAFLQKRKIPLLNRIQITLWITGTLALFIMASLLYSSIESMRGFERFLFSTICILWCYIAYQVDLKDTPTGRFLAFLGRTSYGIYLLHPHVYVIALSILKRLGAPTTGFIATGFAILLTLIAAHLSFKWLESFFITLGKKWVANLKTKAQNQISTFPSAVHQVQSAD